MPSPFFHIPDPAFARCSQIVNNAINAWHNVVVVVAAENIAMGITQSGKTKLISDALFKVMVYGSSGSLWEAYSELNNVVITPEMAPYITKERIEWMKNQLVQSISAL